MCFSNPIALLYLKLILSLVTFDPIFFSEHLEGVGETAREKSCRCLKLCLVPPPPPFAPPIPLKPPDQGSLLLLLRPPGHLISLGRHTSKRWQRYRNADVRGTELKWPFDATWGALSTIGEGPIHSIPNRSNPLT